MASQYQPLEATMAVIAVRLGAPSADALFLHANPSLLCCFKLACELHDTVPRVADPAIIAGHLIGNSVCPDMAEALVRANLPAICAEERPLEVAA
jgi:hypothetical protein